MKKRKRVACILVVLFVAVQVGFSGCTSQRVWTYRPEAKIELEPMLDKSVAVPPLIDERVNRNLNRSGLGLIPLFPYGWQTMYTPEGGQEHRTSGFWLFTPPEDFAKAIAIELQNSGLFEEVFFTHRPNEADLSLKGTIESTQYTSKMYTYCLSLVGVYLWLFGLPSGSASNELILNLKLVDNITDKIIWESRYKKSVRSTSWIYALNSDFFYDTMLKEIMEEVIVSLQKGLG
jgi:hypothetical protein